MVSVNNIKATQGEALDAFQLDPNTVGHSIDVWGYRRESQDVLNPSPGGSEAGIVLFDSATVNTLDFHVNDHIVLASFNCGDTPNTGYLTRFIGNFGPKDALLVNLVNLPPACGLTTNVITAARITTFG